MKIKLPYVIIIVLLSLLVISNLWYKNNIKVETITKTDTIFSIKTDTIKQYYPKLVQTTVYDTIIVPMANNDSLTLYFASKHYTEKEKYDAYISGYNANLDSIFVYNKTVTNTVTNTIENKVYKDKWNLYLDVGMDNICNDISPNIGLSLSMPNGFKLGGEMLIYDNKVYYGLKIGYRIK